jgi:OmcA/MtrC family decaheme c-type cytochrome
LYQDGVITITDIAYEYSAPSTHIVTFTMLKDGEPFDPAEADRVRMYFVPYTGSAFQFEPASGRLRVDGTMTWDSTTGVVTSTLTDDDPMLASSLDDRDGAIMIYGRDGDVARMPNSRVQQAKYPLGGLLETGAGIDEVSAANNDGCENCHSVPFLKHGYYYAQYDDDPTTDFISCKSCHMENAEGGHYEWQLLVDDPEKAVEWLHSDEDTSIFTADQLAQIEYNMSLMNDVHMSHAMEFPYPQSMSNCIVCHEGKLDVILTEEYFNVPTCKSCHAVTGSEEYGTDEYALRTILPSPTHDGFDLDTTDCTICHSDGSALGDFEDIHSGYDKMIYTADGVKYSDAIVVTIDDVSVSDYVVTVELSATEATDIAGIEVEDIVPTVMVGMYGWDTKDYIIGPHERLIDDNGDGEISRSSGDDRALEYEAGDEDHPRGTTVSAADGSWTVTLDMSAWGSLIDDGTVERLEVAVMPELDDADGVTLALDSPSETYDLATAEFVDYYDPIVDVEKCHNCHDALATQYHSPDRGGSIVVCRLCHITKSRGSHLEVQSRSIDSYVHAIHSMQAFDIGDIDFDDAVEALHYDHHTGFPYPTHGE